MKSLGKIYKRFVKHPTTGWMRFFMLGLGLLLAGLLAEGVLRVVDPTNYDTYAYDKDTGLLIYKPERDFTISTQCTNSFVEVNEYGFHGPSYSIEKPDDVFRIAVVGSSFVGAVHVPVEGMFNELLEEKLNATFGDEQIFEVLPIAMAGNGTFLNILYYDQFGAPIDPDLVINLVTEYEIYSNKETAKYPPRFTEGGELIRSIPKEDNNPLILGLKQAGRESKLVMNIQKRVLFARNYIVGLLAEPGRVIGVKETKVADAASPEVVPSDEYLWEIEAKLLDIFHETVTEDDAKYLLMSWVSSHAKEGIDESHPAKLGGIAAELGITYFSLVDGIKALTQKHGIDVTYSCDGHWNQTGHEYVATLLHDYLVETNPELIEK